MFYHQFCNSMSGYNYNAFFYSDAHFYPHFHKNLEVIYVVQGRVSCDVNFVTYTLEPGDFGLCLPYDVHSYTPEVDTVYWIACFSEDYIRSFANDSSGKTGKSFPFRCSSSVEAYLKAQLMHNQAPSVYTLKSCLYALCEEFTNQIEMVEQDAKKSELMISIADYIQKNHTNNIRLSDMAERLGYDYSYVSRYFRKIFRMTFTDFVNIHRLETALRLLDETNEKISTISFDSGFQSVRSFNQFFKDRMGMSPAEYRTRLKR